MEIGNSFDNKSNNNKSNNGISGQKTKTHTHSRAYHEDAPKKINKQKNGKCANKQQTC